MVLIYQIPIHFLPIIVARPESEIDISYIMIKKNNIFVSAVGRSHRSDDRAGDAADVRAAPRNPGAEDRRHDPRRRRRLAAGGSHRAARRRLQRRQQEETQHRHRPHRRSPAGEMGERDTGSNDMLELSGCRPKCTRLNDVKFPS